MDYCEKLQIFVLGFLGCFLVGIDGQYERLFNQCCEWGIDWAQDHNECDKYRLPVNGISVEQQTPCLVTVEICCLRYFRARMCEVGKDLAMQGSECRKSIHPGGEYRKDCCDGCKLGLAAGSRGFSCILDEFTFDFPWDEAFSDCCELGKRSIETHFVPGTIDETPSTNGNNVDECAMFPGQLCAHYCINTPSSFHCECREGFVLHTDGKSCIIVQNGDRCTTNNPCQQVCKDTGVVVQCSCYTGFQLTGDQKSCLDVDECFLNLHTCDPNTQICSNTEGGYVCLSENGSVNAVHRDPQYGSFQSRQTTYSPSHVFEDGGIPVGQCEDGYELNPTTRTCVDVDECLLDLHTCDQDSQDCENTLGSFVCVGKGAPKKCPPGYRYIAARMSCGDIDECAEGKDACNRDREFCLNNIGGYECRPKSQTQCPAGYKFNDHSNRCDDVDECEERIHDCDNATEKCRNTVGGYECDLRCEQGYRYELSHHVCLDTDECLENLDECNRELEDCINTPGSYDCYTKPVSKCLAGYKTRSDNETLCKDVDECEENIDSCDRITEICVNDIGSYRCELRTMEVVECDEGYQFDIEQQQCIDIDECVENIHDCDTRRSICINVQGGFRCQLSQCHEGYRKNTTFGTCEDINECSENLHNCSLDIAECVNTDGGFYCHHFVPRSCFPGHRFNQIEEICEDINECLSSLSDCDFENEVCVNNIGSYTCQKIECPEGLRPNIQSRACEDINECQESLHNCTDNALCFNNFGGFSCRLSESSSCPMGHRFNNNSQRCEDVNECSEESHTCNPDKEMCINTVGSFLCRALICPLGYRPHIQSKTCVDIDECAENLHNCTRDEECVNQLGRFTCSRRRVTCEVGFVFNMSRQMCEDVNECHVRNQTCHPVTQICVNTLGSFRCDPKPPPECSSGYRYDQIKNSCEDIDECVERAHTCNLAQQTCVNAPGSYRCVTKQPSDCPVGYRYDLLTGHCLDMDECVENLHNCQQDHTCINIPGGFQCESQGPKPGECAAGFRLNSDTGTCHDINECQLGSHNCVTSQRCDNTIGSFTCIRITGCGTGYTLNHATGQCEDDDECELGTHHCSSQYDCRNILGSFRCDRKVCPIGNKLDDQGMCVTIDCDAGFKPDDSGNCIDVNECSQHNVCRRNQICTNTVGSYRCEANLRCGQGFQLDEYGVNCIDVDECTTGTHECRGGQNCLNRHGGYACQCPAGYTMNANRDCEDIDECTRYGRICTENGDCHNTPGSYICRCKPGFKQTEDGKTCVDMDECEQAYTCHQKCINTWGSYKCTCNQGYSLGTDERTCQDIDECTLWKGKGNLCIGMCVNEPGSYSCQCPEGYRMGTDKRTCQDIDECAEGGGGRCSGPNEVCLNTRGSFRCNTIVCPPGYVRDRDHRNRCKKESLLCAEGDTDCLHAPLSISMNYITFVTNMKIPASGQVDLFTMRGPLWSTTTVHFSLDLKSARAPVGITAATRDYFRLRRTAYNQAVISLIRSIQGPQDIELELNMKLYANGLYGGQAVAKIFIVVSQFEF